MREQEFKEAMKKMVPALHKKFYALTNAAGIKENRVLLVENLVALTISQAYQNSLRDRHLIISCEQLIRIKAKNVWADHWKERQRIPRHEELDETKIEEINRLQSDDLDFAYTKIDFLLEVADKKSADIIRKKLDGYSVNEIAAMNNTTAAAITMQIQRLKKKIRTLM